MVHHVEHLIGGTFLGGPCDTCSPKQVIRHAVTGSVLGVAAEGDWPEADAALHAAESAFEDWSQTEGSVRAELLRSAAAKLSARLDEFALLMAREIGKPVTQARGELERALITLECSARAAEGFGAWQPVNAGPDPRAAQHRVDARRVPHGVVLAITPWNWPINLALHKLGPALAAGNTVVLKGAQKASLCTLELGRLLHEAGFPAGVVNVVNVPGRVAEQMAEDPRVRKVSFTGSAEVGWRLRERLPRKPVTLELGGNAYALVMPGVDIAAVARELASSATAYAGQICISLQNLRAHEAIFHEFHEAFAAALAKIFIGDPEDPTTECDPMIDSNEADRLRAWVADAQVEGAQVQQWGRDEKQWHSITLINNPHQNSRVVQEEFFGPVVTLAPFARLEEAIQEVNESKFGIHTSLFSPNERDHELALRTLQTPGILLNTAPTTRFDAMPYGGRDESGIGREGVPYAVEEMSTWQCRVIRIG